MEITKYNIVTQFLKNFPELAEHMMNTNHSISIKEPNIYHAENSVWTHTMCVLSTVDFLTEIPQFRKILYFTSLLHDIGKTKTQVKKESTSDYPERYSFKNHEAYSFFSSIDILKKFQEIFNLTDNEIKDILILIGLHGASLKEPYKPFYINELRKLFRQADKSGAIRINEQESDYSLRKAPVKNKKNSDKELLMLIGLPCSGKSTYAKSLENYYIISRDKALEDFYSQKFGNLRTYNEIYEIIHYDEELLKEFNQYFNKILQKAKKYDKILIDMTMLSLKGRRKMINRFSEYTAKCKVFATPLSVIKERNKSRKGKIISDDVYENMIKSFSFPTYSEFDDIEIIL